MTTVTTAMAEGAPSGGNERLGEALAYAEAGLRVFPTHWPNASQPGNCSCGNTSCKSPGKHPLTRRGFKDATTNPAKIKEWWGQFPDANIAAVPGDHEFVLDVDPRNGGTESLERLEREYGPILSRRYRTGSGGVHLWLKSPTPVRARNNFMPGIDIKNSSGYVLMPPSLHVEGKYEIADDREPAPAPAGLIERIGQASGTGLSGGLTPKQLEVYQAPGESEEERLRWTREAVDAIPNEGEFDDRNKWIAMAHAIRESCGMGLEKEAADLFDEFSSRWNGKVGDPHETRRVWETLPASTSGTGYSYLLDKARQHGYQMPKDHPGRAENEFEALPRPEGLEQVATTGKDAPVDELGSLISSLPTAPRTELPGLIEKIKEQVSPLPPADRSVAEHESISKLMKRLGSWPAAERLFFEPNPSEDPSFEFNDGKRLIRPADPRHLTTSSDFLVEGMIPTRSIGEVIAGYGCGKTWLMMELGLSVGLGVPFFGMETQQRPVLFLIYEGQAGIWRRIAGWLHHRGFLSAEFTLDELHALLEGKVLVAQVPPQFDHRSLEEGLRGTIEEKGIGLVIIDTRNKSLGADQSEESNDVAGQVNSLLSRISADTWCTFVTTHHTGHKERGRGRGASAWTQGVDVSYLVKGTDTSFAEGGAMELCCIKMRDSERPKALWYSLKKVEGLKANGVPWDSAVVERASFDPLPFPAQGPGPLQARIFHHILQNPGCSAESIRRSVKGKHEAVQLEKENLLTLGAIENRGEANRHRYHCVDEWEVDVLGNVVRDDGSLVDLASEEVEDSDAHGDGKAP